MYAFFPNCVFVFGLWDHGRIAPFPLDPPLSEKVLSPILRLVRGATKSAFTDARSDEDRAGMLAADVSRSSAI